MVTFLPETKTFYLDTLHSSYVLRILEDGTVVHSYFGPRIPHEDLSDQDTFRPIVFSAVRQIGSNSVSPETLTPEYPTFGRGDYRSPAIMVQGRDGCQVNELRYASHRILTGKPLMEAMPQMDVHLEEVQTLELTLEDPVSGFQAILWYSTFEDVISRRVSVRNLTDAPLRLCRIASASLELRQGELDLITLNGSWGRERAVERSALHHGICSIGSTRGASSHQSSPFLALAEKNTTEASGEVYAMSLIYSGDFQASVEMDAFSTLRVQIGLNPETFSYTLGPGEGYETPEALLTYSAQGLNGMSRNFHRACRAHLGKCADRSLRHPIVINSWEAMYFDFDEEKMCGFVQSCSGLGIDTVVMDDGWFGDRSDDSSALGDWELHPGKLPNGLKRIIDTCHENQMEFGLWFEPEMISRRSRLYEAHPDWCIRVPGREPVESRNQYVLDMSRPEVADCIYDQMAALLEAYDISYIKWDMNRHITDLCSAALPPDRQGELSDRYIRGVYRLISRLENAFPRIYFEGCSGGGGRFDFGMLYYMPQIWTSDDTDAVERMKIQYGTSMVYPPDTIVAHVSACPNHQTGRNISMETRGNVAQGFSLGYELDPGRLSEQERKAIREQIEQHRKLEKLIAEGSFYRLCSPFTTDCCAWQIVAPDRNNAFLMVGWSGCSVQPRPRQIRLMGLEAERQYRIPQLGLKKSGAFFMNVGLWLLPPPRTEYPSLTLELTAEKPEGERLPAAPSF